MKSDCSIGQPVILAMLTIFFSSNILPYNSSDAMRTDFPSFENPPTAYFSARSQKDSQPS